MNIWIILGVIVGLTVLVLGYLIFLISKESKAESEKAVSVNEFRKSFGSETPVVSPKLVIHHDEQTSEPPPIITKMVDDIADQAQTKSIENLVQEVANQALKDQVPPDESGNPDEVKLKEYQVRVEELEKQLFQQSELAKEQAHILQQQAQVELDAKQEEYQQKISQLQQQIQELSQQASKPSEELSASLELLKQENEQLKVEKNQKITSAEANLIKSQEMIASLKEEQDLVQGQLKQAVEQIQHLQGEIALAKGELAKEIANNKSEMDRLIAENQGLVLNMESAVAKAKDDSKQEIEALALENQALKQKDQELTASFEKANELNKELSEASQSLQWELTKSRAQMTSFERACENYQAQLKQLLEKSEVSALDNRKLTETNKSIQATLDNLGKDFEDVSRREKLLQSELENSRAQVVGLLRENETLKAQVPKSPTM